MLEKIGLPAKPSMRGGSWVIDASHCQGCSSQFTFINRKHHCRRCGGLFCNSCTQQRMVLRGQGDSPVRICDPCKKIEEAARFELRYGHRNRAAKGNPKQALKHEEEILGQILGTDGKQPVSSGQESHADAISDCQKFGSTASCSNLNEESATPVREGNITRSISVEMHNTALTDIGSGSPEELRQQAVEEKKKYKILKAEGKSEEALQAFKRGKELERQAGTLEIAIKKRHRMASKASNLSSVASNPRRDESEESGSKRKLPSQKSKEGKDDLATELRELGWSDVDIHDADKKSAKLSLEGELSNLLGETNQKSSQGRRKGGFDKSQITAHKKKALLLKREGKIAEAKDELKKAKILEKQLEEQELLGEDEDSDDELSALIRSMDGDKQDDLLLDHAPDPDTNFNHFLSVTDDLVVDGNFEVTDDDLNDPELAAALKLFGWSEEDHGQATNHVEKSVALDREALQGQVLSLKREALSQKRSGNSAEAMELFKKAKLLERDLESMQSDAEIFVPELKQKISTTQVSGGPSVAGTTAEESDTGMSKSYVKSAPKSKLAIQRELVALKRKALVLRREGRLDEAEEELKKGKVLEQQLEEMENATKRPVAEVGKKVLGSTHAYEGASMTLDLVEEGPDAEVTEHDMHDPALLSVLKNLGWNDDDGESVSMTNKPTKQMNDESTHDHVPSVISRKAMRSKAEVQKDLLSLKRKALALRRQGKTEEAEEVLEKAKALENEKEEMETSHSAKSMLVESHEYLETQKKTDNQKAGGAVQNTDADLLPVMNSMSKAEEVLTQDASDVGLKKIMSDTRKPLPPGSSEKVFETLLYEPQTLRKPGLQAEESAISQPSSLLNFLSSSEKKISWSAAGVSGLEETQDTDSSSSVSVPVRPDVQSSTNETIGETKTPHRSSTLQMAQKKEHNVATTNNSVASEEKLDHGTDVLKNEILAHKIRAVAFKREGKVAEAREELRQAKLLEKSLDDGQRSNVASTRVLASTCDNPPVMQESKTNQPQKPISGRDRFKIQQESLSHKRNALKLRREGKMEESEAELELAKALENQLEEYDSQHSSTSTSTGKLEAANDAAVEDLLDPQLMSALKAIGWQDPDLGMQPSKKTESKPKVERDGNPQAEKAHLEEQIKAEKLRALNLKRAGKQAEALEALRLAKRLEKKLALFT